VLSSPVWRGTPALAFDAGLAVGGMITATVLVVAGSLLRAPLPEPARWALVGTALAVVLLKEAGVLSITLPEARRLVPESVFRFGRHLGPLQFGIEMGTGARTYLPSGLPYAAGAAVLLLASVPAALAAGVGFGLGRALMTTASLRYSPDGGTGSGWNEQWQRNQRRLALLTGSALVVSLLAATVASAR